MSGGGKKDRTMSNPIQVIESKTKRGAVIKVAVIPAETQGWHYEGLAFTGRNEVASQLAVDNGCTHYRVTLGGKVVMSGKAFSDASYGSFGPQS